MEKEDASNSAPLFETPADTDIANIGRQGWQLFYGILTALIVICIVTVLYYGEYGWTLFIALPFTLGFVLTFLQSTGGSWSLIKKVGLALMVVIALSGFLIAVGMEGAICILMASGILVLPVFLGIVLGFWVRKWSIRKQLPIIIPVLFLNPGVFTYDLQDENRIEAVVKTSIVIQAAPDEVWQILTHPVVFGESSNLLLRSGVSHPLSMQLQQKGNQCQLFCISSNDTVHLSVTQLVPKQSMRFSHTAPIVPMREVTFYGKLDAPHLHDYFHSAYGQFEIIEKNGNTCELVASTQYTYKITPQFYWQWCDDV